ncbi:hypothetical protein, partial [Pseudonocardia abyssalis]
SRGEPERRRRLAARPSARNALAVRAAVRAPSARAATAAVAGSGASPATAPPALPHGVDGPDRAAPRRAVR